MLPVDETKVVSTDDTDIFLLGNFSTKESETIVKRITELNNFNDENNEESDEENESRNDDSDDEIITGLSNVCLDESQGLCLTPKGPVFRRNETNNRPAPYQDPSKEPRHDPEVILDERSSEDIPTLPSVNVNTQGDNLLVENVNAYYTANVTLVDPRLIVRNRQGGYIVLPNSGRVTINTSLRKLGVSVPRTTLLDDAEVLPDRVELLFQPDPRCKRTVKCQARIEEMVDEAGKKCCVIVEQFMELSSFSTSGIDVLLQGVSNEDIQAAIDLVKRNDSQDLFKTYGPNSDTMLMTCCCKIDDTPTLRAQIFALTSRILSEMDPSLRRNVVAKNGSGLSALDYTTVTNNVRIGVFLAEIFFALGQDILCKDASGNTILHLMARKGDSVAPTMDALLSLKFRHGHCNKVYSSNVANSKRFLPIHIAAMASKCPQNILRILMADYDQGLYAKTFDGSLPLHVACQYSADPSIIATLLYYDRSSGINESRQDGFTPLHLVTARNEAKDVKLGLIPIDEYTQVRMIKLLLEHGADESRVVENYRPGDLLKPDRVHAAALFTRQTNGGRYQDQRLSLNTSAGNRLYTVSGSSTSVSSGSTSPGQLSSGDRSPVMFPQVYNDPFLSASSASEAESSPGQVLPSPYSPSAHNGSVSSGVDNGFSDESDEDNNGHLDAIALALIGHPTIQAVMDAAEM